MKNSRMGLRRLLSMLLIVITVFSLFSGIIVVEAATVLSIKYERIRQNTLSGPVETNRLLIYGSGFVNPKVKAGLVGELPIPINTSLSNSDVIVIDNEDALKSMRNKVNQIMVLNNGTDAIVTDGTPFDLTSIPTVASTSTDKVYMGEPLDIEGMYFSGIKPAWDTLSVADTNYKMGDAQGAGIEAVIVGDKIQIAKAKSPNQTGISDVVITRNLDNDPRYQIISKLINSITVVNKLAGIAIDRVDPNSGSMDIKNIVNIYGTTDSNGEPVQANFNASMRVFVGSAAGVEGVNKGVIKNSKGNVIGLSVELPKYNIAGAVNLVLTNSDRSSEFVIPNGFIYLNIGNALSIDDDGINPNYKKETEVKPITIMGRNIGYLDAANYDNVTDVKFEEVIGYKAISDIPETNNTTSYKVRYSGKYNGVDVKIIRQINVFIDGDAKIADTPVPTFTKSKDTIVVNAADVNLDPNQPKAVDVSIKTTTVVYATGTPTATYYYSRREDYTRTKGFTYIPDEIAPTVTGITPESGPGDKDILMSIKGFNFQVIDENGIVTMPKVTIGGRTALEVKVYDSENREVDGKKIQLGTRITLRLPGSTATSGAVDVIVKNPSQGQFTLINGFTFKNPSPTRPQPKILSVKEPFADMRGGIITGETILITGENFDASLENDPRVIITIGGEKATIKGKVSADGKTVTVIPPPSAVAGITKLQLINEDGSMAETSFEYRRAITAPKITKIVPSKGGKGTKLVIKGEDFLLPDKGVTPDDPRRKGTVVLLNGRELNAYNYTSTGSITNINDSIYYKDANLDGAMIEVVDSSTIYIDLPDKFYSFDKDAPNYLSSTAIPLGDLSVEVLNPDGAKSKEKMIFTFLKPGTTPVITDITPDSGSINGGTVVRILGSGFRESDLKVYFGSEQATKVQFINSAELVVQVPLYPYSIPVGKDSVIVPVMVMNYDGAMAVYDTPGFDYRIPGSKPQITSLKEPIGSAAGGEEVVIRGKDFRREGENTGLPKVYFNGIEAAEVRWVQTSTDNNNVTEALVAITPPSKVDGPVDVVLVNHDSGTVTYKSYTYQISKPVINTVTPGSIAKLGGTKVQLNGSGFKKNNLAALLTGELVERDKGAGINAASQIESLVTFGDATTGDKKLIDTVVGPYYTTLNDLRFDYTSNGATSGTIKISKSSDAAHTAIRTVTIPVGSAHLFIINGKQDLGDETIGDEGILVEVTPNQAIITRRIAPYAKWENNGLQITVKTPAVASIGTRNIYVTNADGGTASAKVTVLSPASAPTITYISPRNKVLRSEGIVDYTTENATLDLEYYTYTPLDGGAFITINGSDFRKNVKVYMGSTQLEVVSRSVNENQLVVKVPKGTTDQLDKLYRIVVLNEDGGSADSSAIAKPHYIVYKLPESNPIIESVIPYNTSSRGQNYVTIVGTDFRTGAKVYIGGVESPSVSLVENTTTKNSTLIARVPAGLSPGKKVVQVMNTDYGFGEKKDAVNIISSPQIDAVYDHAKDRILSPVIFSIDGGQTIRLTGRDYMEGVRVIIGGTLKPKSELKDGETGIACYNINDAEMVIVGGVAATNVKIVNSATLTFTTPKLKVGDTSIIVVNKDGGVSNVINGNYQKPYPDSPSGISVEVVDSDTIRLEWDKIEGTNHYEIYASYSSNGTVVNNYIYVGSVSAYEIREGRLMYFVDGLKASSWYSFKIKSVNDYGPSGFSYATSYVKTKDTKQTTFYQVAGDYESGIAQNDRVSIEAGGLVYVAGQKSIGNYGTGLVVYFNQASYINYNPKSVDIGVELLKRYPNNTITINEKDFTLTLYSKDLLVKETTGISSSKLSDSKMTIAVNRELKARGDEIKTKVPKGYKAITSPVGINVTMQVEKTATAIKALSGSAELSYSVTDSTRKLYPGGVYIAYYNNTTKALEILQADTSSKAVTSQTGKPGEYLLIGKLTK